MMKTNFSYSVVICLLLQFFGNNLLHAQSRYAGYKQANSIDFVLGGDFGFRMINGDSTDPKAMQELDNRTQQETFKLNYRFGFNYVHGITGNMSIKTGIRFANPGFSITSIEDIDVTQNINSIEKTFHSQGAEYRYNYQLIEIPLGLRIGFVKSICEPYVEFGVATNFYWRTLVEKRFYERGRTKTAIKENLRSVNYISFLSFGGIFTISDGLSGFTQLIGRYQLNNLREGVLTEKIISLGMEVGVRYYL